MFQNKSNVRSLTISLTNPSTVYHAGQSVDGKVILMVEDELKFTEITLGFYGFADVHWTEQHGSGEHRRTVHYRSHEDYFNNLIQLVPKGQESHVFRAGTYEYPFCFTLTQNLPTSYESQIGKVRYQLKVNIDRPWAIDTHTECLVTVLSPFDLNTNPDAIKPSENEGHKTICCLCCASGPITGHIKVERMGYVPGQVIPVDGDVMNNANKTMKEVKVHLIQEVRYITHSKTKVCHVRAAENMLGQLGGNKPMLLHGTRILVPPLPPSGLLGCNIIDINYYAELYVNPSKMSIALRVRAPVIIGSVPLLSSMEQYGNTSVPLQQPSTGQYGNVLQQPSIGQYGNNPQHSSMQQPTNEAQPSNQSENIYQPLTSSVFSSSIPVPTYVPSTDFSLISADTNNSSKNAVAPDTSTDKWTPSYSYYKWN